MTNFRRALLLVTVGNYFSQAIRFALIAVVSRLLTPEEIGISVIGAGTMTIAYSLREFATPAFLIQRKEITREDVRTSFTLLFGLTALVMCAMLAFAPKIARSYSEADLSFFLYVTAVSGLLEVVTLPINALLQRDMAFGKLAVINISSVAINTGVTMALAALGFSYMSFAWAGLCSAASGTIVSLCFRPCLWMFRPSLNSWRTALGFGSCNGMTTLLYNTYLALPQLVLGYILPLSAVGLYNRASAICRIPETFILSQVLSVAFPAFAARVRKGDNLKQPYLQAISYMTVVHWPALVILALLAHPIVMIVVGPQWSSIVPLVQVMCVAGLFWSPVILTHQVLIALGAIKQNLLASLIARPAAALVLCLASFFGLTALAASQLLATPLQLYIAFRFIRPHVPLKWGEMATVAWKGALVTACSAAGPVAVMASTGFHIDLSAPAALVAAFLSAICWACGLYVARHPFLIEVQRVLGAIEHRLQSRRLFGAGLRLCNRVFTAR